VTGRELGLRWADLVIDSFGLEVGAFLDQPAGLSFASVTGLQAGLGLELPLLGRPSGPWIDVHAGVRVDDGAPTGGPVGERAVSRAFLSLTVAYHQLYKAHLVDFNDRAP
jgi:hypothetical protein